MTKLSKNFYLHEFLRSEKADILGIKNNPTERQVGLIKALAVDIMQPIRDYFNSPITISSGFRSKALNEAVDGVPDSYHRFLGKRTACDFIVEGVSVKDVFDYVRSSPLPYHKIIREFNRWNHISYSVIEKRAFIASKKGGRTVYKEV